MHGFLLGLAVGFPARAIVVRAGQADQARRAGAEQHAVVGLLIEYPLRQPEPLTAATEWGVGTGVYLGRTPDGKGWILTAAHLFAGDGTREAVPAPIRVLLAPGELPDPNTLSPLPPLVEAKRVWIHSEFRYFDEKNPGRRPQFNRNLKNDLALVECEASTLLNAPDGQGLSAATFYEGSEFQTRPMLEAEIAGYGLSGTQEDAELARPGRRHAGSTYVSHGEWMERTAFIHGSALGADTLRAVAALRLGHTQANLNRFLLGEAETTMYVPLDPGEEPMPSLPIRLQPSHPNQAVIAAGDSGGPLFLAGGTGRERQLAGIASCFEITRLVAMPGRPLWDAQCCLLEIWEPIMGHVPWIRSIQERLPEAKATKLELCGTDRYAKSPPA
jgi:hypothetical protein